MEQIQNELIAALTQVAVLTLIPLIFFLFRKDKSITFSRYLGLHKPTGKSVWYAIGIAVVFAPLTIGLNFLSDDLKQAVLAPDSIIGKLRLMGLSNTTVVILLVTAIFKTSLSEEIFFRGFIAKRLIHKAGFTRGNMIQAFIFGILHVLLFGLLIKATLVPLILIFIVIFLFAWIIGYVQEKIGNGSIVPGWIIHGLGNMICYYVVAFVV